MPSKIQIRKICKAHSEIFHKVVIDKLKRRYAKVGSKSNMCIHLHILQIIIALEVD